MTDIILWKRVFWFAVRRDSESAYCLLLSLLRYMSKEDQQEAEYQARLNWQYQKTEKATSLADDDLRT